MSDPQPSGADLARVALAAARQAAKNRPASKTKTRRVSSRRGADGRDPMQFGAAVDRLMTEQGWETPTAGGGVLAEWATLCPELVGHVAPEGYDPDRGELRLRPASHTYRTHLSVFQRQLVARINEKLGKPVVRSIRILPVGPIPELAVPATAGEPAEPVLGPVRTRETASPGYRHNLALHQQHKPDTATEHPLVAAARARLDALISDPAHREPPEAFTDGVAEAERVATSTADQHDAAEAVRQAAIRMARAQKAGHGPAVRRAFEAAS
ncbi:DciA family protein [Streptomyces sp. 8L]|uniref:DciA family protein n=1 Tax=Streptomyces sp. 8L TaxID=2877242 RepID=UPI001CD3AF0A|nr:DUF721 domain-containing protein [Streptomyces sp. 8L]MCA1223443.1 DciA family protein [Streptomyces sp. 8L]